MKLFTALLWLSATTLACTTTVFAPGGGDGGAGSTNTSTTATTASTSSGGTNFGACDFSSQCTVQEPGCCQSCSEITLDMVEPINRSQSQAFREATCESGQFDCPACEPAPTPSLYAYCEAGQCQKADVRTAGWNECTGPDDCRLRAGTECCESCQPGSFDVIAVPSSSSALTDQVCDEDIGCPECVPQYPEGAIASCIQGSCVVEFVDF